MALEISITVTPSFWQRIRFLFCRGMIIRGIPAQIKDSNKLTVEFR
jgi:hypothetical protein